MRALLDTHVFVWALAAPDKLGKITTQALLDAETDLYVSSISALEVARLVSLRQLELSGPADVWYARGQRDLGAVSVPIDDRVAVEAYSLPGAFHADPADRLLAATARVHGLCLVTADERILAYPHVRTQDARR